jgi:hypothetical protein
MEFCTSRAEVMMFKRLVGSRSSSPNQIGHADARCFTAAQNQKSCSRNRMRRSQLLTSLIEDRDLTYPLTARTKSPEESTFVNRGTESSTVRRTG